MPPTETHTPPLAPRSRASRTAGGGEALRTRAGGSFLGREREISELAELLGCSRLVTLTGPPGIGKSRLALETARNLGGRYPDGVRLVELAPVGDPALIPGALAAALSLSEVPGQSLQDTIVARLSKRRLLLVLDNCEHLLVACTELVSTLLGAGPEISVLATSREPLGVGGETVWQVPPLSVPDPSESELPEVVGRYEAARLFVERSALAQPGFALNAYVAPAVAEICRRLDGIPLAIELAAARVETLTPAEIARRLDDRYALLRNGSSAVPRHQTLLAALDWSHELLSVAERALLRRLSVFAGGFELEAAEAVCPGDVVERSKVADLLARLASKSLVVPEAAADPRSRYRLLETVRVYAGERLEEAGEAAGMRAAHARFYLALAERAEPELTGARQRQCLGRLELERENFRLAFDWSLGHGHGEWALRLAGALVLFWRVRCHFSEGRELLEAALSASNEAPPQLRAKALWGAGFLTMMIGDLDRALPALEESLTRFRELEDLQGQARALLILGNALQNIDGPKSLSMLDQSASLARRADDRWCLAHALGVAGFERAYRDDLAAAHELFEECLGVAREAQDEQSLRIGLIGLGSVALREGDYRLAESLLDEALIISGGLGESYSKAAALQYLGQLAIGRGEYQDARDLLEMALALFREGSSPGALLLPFLFLAQVARADGDLHGARRLLDETVRTAGTDAPLEALHGIGELAVDEGDLATARSLLEETLGRARAAGASESTAQALFALAELTRVEGDLGQAALFHGEALALYRAVGNAPLIVASLEAVAGLDAAAGGPEHSARLLGAAQALRDSSGYARAPWESSRYEADLALIREALGDEGLDAAWVKGERLSIEQAMALASKLARQRGRPDGGWAILTPSERQVAELAAGGLTNPEIAERLFIAMGTVKAHLSHTFQKLGITGRTQLAREIWRREQEKPGANGSAGP